MSPHSVMFMDTMYGQLYGVMRQRRRDELPPCTNGRYLGALNSVYYKMYNVM